VLLLAIAASCVLLAGVAVGATSIGGVLVVPVLTTIADVPATAAVAAASFAFGFTGIAGFLATRHTPGAGHALDGGALIGAAVGALTLAWMPPVGVRWAVGLIAVGSGVAALVGVARSRYIALAGLPLALLGLCVGCVSAWSGTGGPVVLLPLLALLGWPALRAVDAAQRVQLPVALAATVVNLAAGRLDLRLGLALGVLVLAGWAAGRAVATRLPRERLQQAVAVALIGAGLAYL
jgi:uncharacterized membrane protein YfcA